MKYSTLLAVVAMFLFGLAIMLLIPIILPDLDEGLQAGLIIIIILAVWFVFGRWWNQRG